MSILVLLALALVLALALLACGREAPRPSAVAPLDRVLFSGCASIGRGPVCERPASGAIALWLPASQPLAALAIDGGEITPPSWEEIAGGRVHRVVVPEVARSVTVTVTDAGVRRAWTLAIAPARARAAVVARAGALRDEGRAVEAGQSLRAALPSLAGADHASATSALARVQITLGDATQAAILLEQSSAENESLGRLSDAANDDFARVFLLLEGRRFAPARAALGRTLRWAREVPEAEAYQAYYEGFLARETGDARSALARLDDAPVLAARLGLDRLSRMARAMRAIALQELGRADDSIRALRAIEASDAAKMPPCDRAELLVNVGWAALLAADAGEGGAGVDPEPPLTEARALFREACGDRRREANAVLNLAWAASQRSDAGLARARLAEARALVSDPAPVLAFFAIDLEGRIALAEHDARRALASFDRLAQLAAMAGAVEDEWRAEDGRAEALAMSGHTRDAIAASARAEAILDERVRGVPLGEGLGTFLGARERTSRRRVGLLLAAGDPARALAAAREARARIVVDVQRVDRIAHLDPAQRARYEDAIGAYRAGRDALAREAAGDWTLPADALARAVGDRKAAEGRLRDALERAALALPAPPPVTTAPPDAGELVLAFHPLDHGWAAFAQTSNGVRAAHLGAVDPHAAPAALASALLAPFHDEIAASRRVRVLAYGALRAIDVHALPFDGAPLVAHGPVEYPLDLAAPALTDDATSALVVGDPASDLPASRREARAVAAALTASSKEVRVLVGGEADRAGVAPALAEARFFHYAGHGVFGGRDGWESELPLAGTGHLTVGDVLALPRAPGWVVLSGCETARAGSDARPEGLGLAQAFLAAGSESVIAATRDVDDASTAELMTALYAHVAGDRPDLGAALRNAQLALIASGHAADWAAFRALRR